MNRRQTTTGCALAAATPAPSPLPRFSEPCSPVLDAGMAHRRRTSTPGTIPLSSAAAGKPSRLGPSRTSEMGSTDAMRRQTVASGMTSTSPAATAAAAKPAVVLLPARSASDHPASWSIHAFDASSASSTPISCPGTPAAKTPSAAPNSLGSACSSGSSSSSTGRLLATPRQQAAATPSRVPPLFTNQAQGSHPSDRRQTVASASPAALTARPRSLLGRIRSLNARQNPTSFEVEASSVSTTACSTPSACGSTTAAPAAPSSPTHHAELDHAAADSQKQPAAVALGQPCTALVPATVKAIILAQPPMAIAPMGVRQPASLPFSRGPTLDMELSPEEVLWVMQPPVLSASPAAVPPMAASRSSLLPRLLRRMLGRLSCTAHPAVVN